MKTKENGDANVVNVRRNWGERHRLVTRLNGRDFYSGEDTNVSSSVNPTYLRAVRVRELLFELTKDFMLKMNVNACALKSLLSTCVTSRI